MPQIGSLSSSLSLESAQFLTAVKKINRGVDDLNKNVSSGLSAVQNRFNALADMTKGAVAGFGVLGAIGLGRQFLSIADEAKSLTAQLRLATSQTGSFGVAMADVQRIARETRAGLSETSSLYGNFIRASQALGASQAAAARATETFSKALTIGGAGANEAASATLQFGQALAAGVLRGDEFNSIMEASPRIARLLADSLGVPVGQLRAMAEQGELTADKLFKALTERKFTASIDQEFRDMPVTFGQAMTLVHNAAVTTFGAFDQGGGFSTALADFVGRGSDGFAGMAKSAEQFGIDTRAVFDGLGNVFDPIEASGTGVFDRLGVKIYSVREQIQSLLDSYDRFANFDANIENAVKRTANRAIDRAGGGQHFEMSPLSNAGGRFRAGSRISAARSRQESAARRLEGLGFEVPRNADGSVNEAGIRKLPKLAPPKRTTPPPTSSGAKKTGGRGRSTAARGDTPQESAQQLVDALLPDEAEWRRLLGMAGDLRTKTAGGLISGDVFQRVSAELESRMSTVRQKISPTGMTGGGWESAKLPIVDMNGALGDLEQKLPDLSKIAARTTGEVVETFAGMARDVTASLGSLAQNIKSGDWLGALSSVLDIATQVTGIVRGTKTPAVSTYPLAGKRAAGGPVMANRSYLVGERGPEILRMGSNGGSIVPNDQIGGAVRVHVEPSRYFDVVVDGRAGAVAAPMAAQAAVGGSTGAQVALARKASRRIP